MVVVLREGASPEDRAEIIRLLSTLSIGCVPRPVRAVLGEIICVAPSAIKKDLYAQLAGHPGVERVIPVCAPYPLASREVQPQKTVVRVGVAPIGGPSPVIIAGPCSVEGEEQIFAAARAAQRAGAQLLRGGVFKPRTSPYSFQGLGLPGLELLARAGAAFGLPIVTEVMEPGLVMAVAERADILQIGSRNMQNYPLLRAAGRTNRPVLLKRGFAATIEEWLLAAEYILAEGNPHVILCERGVRGFDQQTRNLLDLTCVPLVGQMTHLPILVDPSHATGRRDLVVRMGVAAIAAGADGLLVEMHPNPDAAISDGEQTIDPEELRQLVRRTGAVRAALDAVGEPDGDHGLSLAVPPEELVASAER
jgi:3-deoxy-7-phosphoheptulonate synthase